MIKAYALLSSLRQNLPDKFEVGKEWVDDYHSILDSIEKETGEGLGEFRVSSNDVYLPVVGGNTITGEIRRGKKFVVQRTRLLMKVDAVLEYFQFQETPENRPIGFRKS